MVMKYVEMGFGVSMLPGMIIQPKDKNRLYLRDLSEVDEKGGISKYGILLKRGKYISPAAKELIRFLSPEIDFDSLK